MKAIVFIILLVAVSALFVATNPSMDDYQNQVRSYIIKEVIRKSQKSSEASLGLALSPLLGRFAERLAARLTTRNDYVFFSIYTCEFEGERLKLLGILKNFIVLEAPKKGLNLHKRGKLENSNSPRLLSVRGSES